MKLLSGLLLVLLLCASAHAQVKVNALPAGATPSGPDFTICDQSGATNKCTMAQVASYVSGALSGVPLTALAPQAAFTILCNASGSLATPAACGSLPTGVVVPAGIATGMPGGVVTSYGGVLNSVPAFITPQQYGAKCDGSTDDATALQNWLNATSYQTPGYIPPGTCAYHTALVWPVSDTYIYGVNPIFFNSFNQSVLKPVGCRAMTIDGSLYGGGYSERHTIRDLAFDMTNASDATALVYLNNVYTVHVDNVTFNNAPTGTAVEVLVQGTPSNDVSFDHTRIYGIGSGLNTGIALKLSSVSFKAYDLDIEGFNGSGGIGVLTTGTAVWADFNSIYMEGLQTSFSHQITYGQVNVNGGTIQPGSTASTVVSLGASNFSMIGVGIQYNGAVIPITYTARGLTGISILNSSSQYPTLPFVNAGADLSGSNIWPPSTNGFGPNGATWGTPTVLPPSGSFANNGVLTLGTAMPVTLPNAWMYFPSGAIYSGSAAGVYYTQCTTTTACTVFSNTLASGVPYNIASPTAFTGRTGPGAYTQTTSSNITLFSITVHGGSEGPGGSLTIDLKFGRSNDASAVLISPYFGGVQIGEVYPTTGNQFIGYHQIFQNIGAQNSQVNYTVGDGCYTDVGVCGAGQYQTVNTASDQSFQIQVNSPAATTTTIVYGGTIKTTFAE